MQTINLKQYYPFCKEDIFVEVSDEIVEAFLLDKRAEGARDRKMFRYKAFYSLDCNDGIENAAIGWAQPSPEDYLIEKEELAESSMFAPSLAYQFVLVMLIAVLGAFFGKWKYVIKAVCFYAVICALTVWIMAEMTGTLRTMFIAFLGLFHKVYACGTLAGIVLTTTKVNEFLSAMNRVHAPKKLVIPMAVMLRYIPTIQEDWRYIKDAMRMRDVSPSLASFLAHPGMTVECIYVPLLMAASKAADDLSVASVTRGIENPNPRTCLVQIKCGAADWGVMAVAVAYLIFELCVRGGVIG